MRFRRPRIQLRRRRRGQGGCACTGRSRSAPETRAVFVEDCTAHFLLVDVVVPSGGNDAKKRGVRGLELGLARRDIGRDGGAKPCHCWDRFAR